MNSQTFALNESANLLQYFLEFPTDFGNHFNSSLLGFLVEVFSYIKRTYAYREYTRN